MKRTLAHRLAALGLLAVFQFGAMPNSEHVGCVASATGSHAGAMAGMHGDQHHDPGGMDMSHPEGMDQHADHSGDQQTPSGCAQSCCDGLCLCPQVQPSLTRSAPEAGSFRTATRPEAPLSYDSPALAKGLYLLPFPNAPPEV